MSLNNPRVAIVGATGAVGKMFLELFAERSFPCSELHLVASFRSAGRVVKALGGRYIVQDLEQFDFSRVDIAFFSAGGSVSEQWAPKASAAGAVVIDNTNAFRMDPQVRLVVPQINGSAVDEVTSGSIIANPNCSTIPLVRLLFPIEQRWGISSIVVSTYQAASGRGLSGMTELREHSRALTAIPDHEPQAEVFPEGLAFNVIPSIDRPLDTGFTLEERKMLQESRKILDIPDLQLTATCVRVPVINSHSEAVYIRCRNQVDRDELVKLLASQPEVAVHDAGDRTAFPTPRTTTTDPDRVHVGRVRKVEEDPYALWLWVVADNLRIGAALNAVQIAERTIRGELS